MVSTSICNTPVLIVDDDRLFRDSLRIVLEQTPGEWLIYEAGSIQETAPLLSESTIAYAIVDVHLPDGTAADIIRLAGAIPCLLCTQDDNELTFRKLFEDPSLSQSIVGYLLKPLQSGAIWNIRAGLQIGRERQIRSRLVAEATAHFEDERRLIAQNLHDEMGASLTQLRWIFSSIDRAVKELRIEPSLSAQLAVLCAQGKQIIGDAHTGVSQAITQLRPEAVAIAGLKHAVEYMVAQWKCTAPGVEFKCFATPDLDNVDSRRAGVVYRLIQEGITNAMRHTMPDQIEVNVTCREKTLRLAIISNVKVLEEKDSYALTVLRERTSSLGGVLHFTCDVDQRQTCLLVNIPI